jgi:HSP20 family molecular chaperone IbpA
MTEISRRQGLSLPDIRDLFDPFGLLDLRPKLEFHGIRVEDRFEDDRYLLMAEIPGIDPEHDVELVVSDGTLTILAERSEEQHDKRHSEFRYGTFSRSVRLPASAKEDQIAASYDAGVLTVTVPLKQSPKSSARKIEVKSAAKSGAKSAAKSTK